MAGIMVGIVDVLIWRHFVPSVADIRTAPQFNGDIEAAERTALLVGSGFTLVSGSVRNRRTGASSSGLRHEARERRFTGHREDGNAATGRNLRNLPDAQLRR
jgi:hypothetical protein